MLKKPILVAFIGLGLWGCDGRINTSNSPAENSRLYWLCRFTTSAPDGGKYKDLHVLSAWIEDRQGRHIRTLCLYGRKHAKQLTQWNTAVSKYKNQELDARTGATIKGYREHILEWDLTDRLGNLVQTGDYRLKLELTNDNAKKNKYHRAVIEFSIGSDTYQKKLDNQGGFMEIYLEHKKPENRI